MATTAGVGSWHTPAGSAATGPWTVEITPESAGWGFSGVRVAALEAGKPIDFATDENEAIVLPLAGSASVICDDTTIELSGRPSPFAGPTDFAYLPRDASVSLRSAGGARIAVAMARADLQLPVRHVPLGDVPIELRGAGACSREVRNFGSPDAFEADRLIAVEVITPGGNWSSYPPHKHDEDLPDETALEEIYYYEIAPGPAGPGIGYQRVYGTSDRPIDVLVEIRDGDALLIPHGWHGPTMAAPGYDMYYLNVMAGPGPRAWRITDDPAHSWIRDTWAAEAVDQRLQPSHQRTSPGRSWPAR